MDEAKTVERFLAFLRETAESRKIAEQEETDANDATQDILHRLELCDDDYRETARLAKVLREVRRKRRTAKDAGERAAVISAWVEENLPAVHRLERALGELRKLEKRNEQRFYNPRTHICDKEDRQHEKTVKRLSRYDPGADPCRAGRAGEPEDSGADCDGERGRSESQGGQARDKPMSA